jgi:hypothetical protein
VAPVSVPAWTSTTALLQARPSKPVLTGLKAYLKRSQPQQATVRERPQS